MKTLVELRVLEKWANREYGSLLGEPMVDGAEPPFVRKIVLEVNDPRLADLRARLDRDNKNPAVLVHREYTSQDLAVAELFQLIVTGSLSDEACGEDYGTEYDDCNACSICGEGRIQRSPLRLDLSLAPVGVDIARTIALGELIVSQRLVNLMHSQNITGYRVQEVEHTGKRIPTGRWYQLNVTGNVGQTVDPTQFGINYFKEDTYGTYTCAKHLLSGLHILSEAYVSRQTVETVDMALTANRTGRRSGILMPTPLIVTSPRFFQLIIQNNVRGCKLEVAHIVGPDKRAC